MSEMKIVRSKGSGVWAAEIVSKDGTTAVLKNAIRIWYWAGAASLSELAMIGTKRPSECKFCIPVDEVEVYEIVEILSITDKAEASIKGVEPWTA